MKPLYALLRDRCGLSLREAAEFHGTSENSVMSWSAGRRNPPAGIIAELRALYAQIETAAADLVTLAREAGPEVEIELGLAADDAEARSIGWPCVGAHAAALGLAAARLDNQVRIVARGTTLATAAAADLNDRR